MNSYLANIDQYFQQQEEMQQDEDSCINDPDCLFEDEETSMELNYPKNTWLHDMAVTSSSVLSPQSACSNNDMFIPASSQSFVPNMTSHFNNQDYSQHASHITSQPTHQSINSTMPPAYDIHGLPVRIRKKPGRKPNPASPALRKAQNRAAQRAFRERKEKHLNDLEGTIRTLRDQRNAATKELKALKETVEGSKAETWYLKGVVLTLQFVCMHHNIRIPTHSPYLSRSALEEMAQTSPHTTDAYINAYTHNNESLKSTSYYSCLYEADYHKPSEPDEKTPSPCISPVSMEHHDTEPMDAKPIRPENKTQSRNDAMKGQLPSPSNSIDAIENIRQKLGIEIAYKMDKESNGRLRPTVLQLAIPHDPRIDLIPTPHTRDRMILFKDQMDYDRCFSLLLNGSVYRGGDPTETGSWELSPEFFSEFWYLTLNYDIDITNQWRRLNGLQDVSQEPVQSVWPNQMDDSIPNGWDRDMYYEIIENMPVLQPFDQVGYPLPPSRSLDLDTVSNMSTPEDDKPIYQNEMCAPESRTLMNLQDLGSFHHTS
jgi:hypothetical protein